MPRRRAEIKQKVQVAHLKYAAISNTTLIRYRKAVHEIFIWLSHNGLLKPRSVNMLDQLLGEYLNELFIAGAPLYIGANAIVGLKKIIRSAKNPCQWLHCI